MKSGSENLHGEIIEKNRLITELQNRVFDLETRVTEGMEYSSKDCVILEIMLLKDPKQLHSQQVCDILKH